MKKKRPRVCIPKSDEGYVRDLIAKTRVYSIIIILLVLVSDFTTWAEFESLKLIILLMALLLFTQTFARFLDKNPKAKKALLWVLAIILILGIIIFFSFK